jgi:hypothetical protein
MSLNSHKKPKISSFLTFHISRSFLFQTVEEGARTIVFAAIEPQLEGKGGCYLTNCLIKEPVNDIAHDDKECEKLFKFTCNMLNIENFGKESFNNNQE